MAERTRTDKLREAEQLIQGGVFDFVEHPLSCDDALSIKIAE